MVIKKTNDKGVFLKTQKYVIKTGSDLSVDHNGINFEFLKQISQQCSLLVQNQVGLIIVASGATKLGKILARNKNEGEISKTEAEFRGFNPLMNAWQKSFTNVGISSIPLTLTGQNFTRKNIIKLKKQIDTTNSTQVTIANSHYGLNSKRFKHYKKINNNDFVGEELSELCAQTYIICTNVDGVLDKNGNIIHNFENLEQLNDIVFYKQDKTNGTGGMETKLSAAIKFSLSGGTAYIVNGKEQDILLKIYRGEKIGTCVKLQ